MSLLSRLAVLATALLAVAAPPATARTSTAGEAPLRTFAKARFAVFRAPAKATDRITARHLPTSTRRQLRGAETRRIAAGMGWSAYVVVGPGFAKLPGQHFDAALLAVEPHGRLLAALPGAIGDWASTGALLEFRPAPDRPATAVALVPDTARRAVRVDRAGTTVPRRIRRNAVVDASDGDAIRWYTAQGAATELARTLHDGPVGTPLNASLLDGSHVTLDLGGGNVRTVPLTGSFQGFIPGGYQIGLDNTAVITRGKVGLGATDLLTDACSSPALAALDPASGLTLDPTRQSSMVVHRDGTVAGTVAGVLRSVLDLRQQDGCGAAAVPSGYADTAGVAIDLHGTIQRATGLADLALASDPTPLTINACMAPGDPAAPCPQDPTPYTATATVDVHVRVAIG